MKSTTSVAVRALGDQVWAGIREQHSDIKRITDAIDKGSWKDLSERDQIIVQMVLYAVLGESYMSDAELLESNGSTPC